MNALSLPLRALALTLAAAALPLPAPAQSTPPPADPAIPPTVVHHPKPHPPPTPTTINQNLIYIDPAHGAADNGAVFSDQTQEKDITLALANRFAGALKAKGFTVIITRTNSTDDVPFDTRVDLANRSRPLACLLLHASNGGHGVHLFTSALTPPTYIDPNLIVPWDTAQTAALPQSLRLSNDLATALNGIRVPLVTGRASVRPIDSLTCPAVAVEIASIAANGDTDTPVSDPNYQARVAEALASAMVFWRVHVEANSTAPAAHATADAQASGTAKAPTPPSAPKPAPKPIPKPKAAPLNLDDPTAVPAPVPHKPAPIVRIPPPPPDAGAPLPR